MEWLFTAEGWIAFVTLAALELVLGVDNIIFISILAGRLPETERARARTVGLVLAMLMRIGLLFSISWVVRLTEPLFEIFGHPVAGRDLILFGGGLFLMAKSTHEIHNKLEGAEGHGKAKAAASFSAVIVQIMLLDIVFSLDSVITAVGMVDEISIMVSAVIISVAVMMVFAAPIGAFVERHPTVKMLALSFLLLIGFTLVAEGFHLHIPKGYIYFAIAFSVLVEALNLRLRGVAKPVKLHEPLRQG
jgi:predicted tellurium resistance membrane protein TerC